MPIVKDTTNYACNFISYIKYRSDKQRLTVKPGYHEQKWSVEHEIYLLDILRRACGAAQQHFRERRRCTAFLVNSDPCRLPRAVNVQLRGTQLREIRVFAEHIGDAQLRQTFPEVDGGGKVEFRQ